MHLESQHMVVRLLIPRLILTLTFIEFIHCFCFVQPCAA
jgi:hypothetical protein